MADQTSTRNLTVILATTLPSAFLILLAAVLCYRVRRRNARFIKRGITPIDDEEIESWKLSRTQSVDEKSSMTSSPKLPITEPERTHHTSTSVGSVQKPPSVIVYQNSYPGGRRSDDQPPWSPAYTKRSVEIPQTPIIARAPNSRPGLTDESVQGDVAFVNVKRHARLSKHSPGSPRHARTRSSFGNASRDLWYPQTSEENLPRPSGEALSKSAPSSRAGHRATLSSPTTLPRHSYDEEILLGGLSPRSFVHRSEIGRAIG